MFVTSRRTHQEPRSREGLSRQGFALFMALGALVIIAVLVAGSSFITMQETRLGQNQLVETKAFSAAEYGLNKIQADWDKTPNLQMANGANFDTTYALSGVGTCKVRYTRLNNETFWIVSEGRATVGNSLSAARVSVKRVGAVLRLRVPSVKAEGAVTTAGNINAQGSATIKGQNQTDPGWTGCDPGPDKAALVVGTTATVNLPNGANANNVTGNPPVQQSAFATDSNTYVKYGDETWTALVASANITATDMADGAPTTNADGSCNKSNQTNYGEPWHNPPVTNGSAITACNNYFPIVYISGTNVGSHGGRGQGILLINGDFTFNAGFEWHGLIIVKDDIKKGNGHSSIYGGIMARNAVTTLGDNTEDLSGTVDILYSSCALDRSMRGSAQVVQAKQRAWVELY